MSELMPLNNLNAMDVFQKDGLQPILDRVADEARSVVPDVTTEKGRKEIASIAFKVAKSKTYLDGLGKDLVSDWKKQAKVVDNERKRSRDFLDDLKDEVRRPLTEWEQAEQERIEKHTNLIELLSSYGVEASNWMDRTLESLRADMDALKSENTSLFEEFEDRASEVISASISKVADAIDKKRTYETEQAELEKLRQEAAEREARESAERAEKARKEREEQIRIEAAEKEKRAAAEREQALEREKQAAHDAKIRAEEQAAAAQKRAEEAEKLAKAKAEEEQARIEQQEADEIAKRERNKQHKGKIHREIAEAIEKAANLSPATSKKIVTAMARGEVPHVGIKY